MSKNQLAKIVVEGQEDTVLVESCLKDDIVWLARQCLCCMQHIVTLAAQPMNNARREILIGKISFAHADFAVGASK